PGRLLLVQVDGREGASGHLGDRQQTGSVLELLQRSGPIDGETADPGTPQAGQVPGGAEGGTEVAGQGPDVGARGAGDVDLEVDHRQAVQKLILALEQVESADRDRASGELDLVAGSDPGVGAPPVDLD